MAAAEVFMLLNLIFAFIFGTIQVIFVILAYINSRKK